MYCLFYFRFSVKKVQISRGTKLWMKIKNLFSLKIKKNVLTFVVANAILSTNEGRGFMNNAAELIENDKYIFRK